MTADQQIRTAIRDILAIDYPNARIWPFLSLGHDLQDWPAMFRTASGDIHGYTIFRRRATAVWHGSGGRDKRRFEYAIWAFYQWRPGKIGDNSDDEFSAILETNYLAIKTAPRLGLDNVVEEHNLLQIDSISTLLCGEETLHIATASLSVTVCC
jgi:hypothetical protein